MTSRIADVWCEAAWNATHPSAPWVLTSSQGGPSDIEREKLFTQFHAGTEALRKDGVFLAARPRIPGQRTRK